MLLHFYKLITKVSAICINKLVLDTSITQTVLVVCKLFLYYSYFKLLYLILCGSWVGKKVEGRGGLVIVLGHHDNYRPYEVSHDTWWKLGVLLAERSCSCSTGNLRTNIWSTDCGAYTQVSVWLSDSQQAHEYGMGFSHVVKWLHLQHGLTGNLAHCIMNRHVLLKYEFCMRLFL